MPQLPERFRGARPAAIQAGPAGMEQADPTAFDNRKKSRKDF